MPLINNGIAVFSARGQGRHQVEQLKHETDVLAAIDHTFVLGELLQVLTIQRALAVVLVENAGDDRDEGRLAATGGTYQHEQFARKHLKVDPPQGLHLRLAGAVGLGDAAAVHRQRF